MTRPAAFLTLIALALTAAAPASAAEPKLPLFAGLGVETVDGRQGAVAAPLADGRVLIAGGSDNLALRSAEIFDPVAIAFEEVPHLTRYARSRAMAAPLPDGRVLIAGGANEVVYAHAEIFDPETEEFTDVDDEMTSGRIKGVAAPLPDGRVLITGGFAEGATIDSAEVFDPDSETFTALAQKPQHARSGAIGVALPDGRVVIAGGNGPAKPDRSVEIFDPSTETFSLIGGQMPEDQALAAAAALPNGEVLIAGGISGGLPRKWSGLLDPETGNFEYLPKEGGTELTTERADAVAAPLPGGMILLSGGSWPDARSSAEVFVSAPALGTEGTELGPRLLGKSGSPATVTVTSLGGWKLEIDSVALAGPDAAAFSIRSDTCTAAELSFGESCTLGVEFTPLRAGPATASLLFGDNEPTPAVVPLTASGTAMIVSDPPTLGSLPTAREVASVRCGAQAARTPGRVKVTCQVNSEAGAWSARLWQRGRIVARRRISGGKRRLSFHLPRTKPGRYRLELVPLSA